MEDKVGILTFEQWHSTVDIGSSRIRGSWIAENWAEAELFVIGRKYSVVIFQKAYWLDFAMQFGGIKILDVCDPDFLDWNSPCIAMANRCDAVTASTQALATMISRYTKTPCYCIPDRLHPFLLDAAKTVQPSFGTARTVGWFGYSSNYPSLDWAIPDLMQHGIDKLVVISRPETPYELPAHALGKIELVFVAWNYDALLEQLSAVDIVINYKRDYGKWQYKSNNKSVLSWALGIPVAHSPGELEALLPRQAREAEAARRLKQVRAEYNVSQTVEDLRRIIDAARSRRASE
jgi:hypothetical protein